LFRDSLKYNIKEFSRLSNCYKNVFTGSYSEI